MRNYDQVDSGLERINTMLSTAKAGMEHKNADERTIYDLISKSLQALELVQTLVRREKP